MSGGFTETSLNDIPIDEMGGGGMPSGLGNPNINDIELQNIVNEIQQEQQQIQQQPEIPTESFGQTPPMPQQQFQQNYQNVTNAMQQEHLHNKLDNKNLYQSSSLFSPQSALSSIGASRPTKIINDITGNLKLIIIIILTYVLLQQPQVRYFILNKITSLQNQNYLIQTSIFGLFQVLLIILLKNFF